MNQFKPYVIGGGIGGLALLGILVLTGMMSRSPVEDLAELKSRNADLKSELADLKVQVAQGRNDGTPRSDSRPSASPGDDEHGKTTNGYPDLLSYYAPPTITVIPFAPKHRLEECVREFAAVSRDAYDGVLFAEPGQKLHFASVAGAPQFHVHLLTEVEKDGKREVTKDELLASTSGGVLQVSLAGELPTKAIVVMPPMTIDYPGVRALQPPYTVTMRILPISTMQAVLSAQGFVTAISAKEGTPPDLFTAVSCRSDAEFGFGAYDVTGKRADLATRLYLCSGERFILQPTFRALVTTSTDQALSKFEVLSYPPDVSYQAAGASFFDLEENGRVLTRVACPERPFLSLPNNPHEPLPRATIAATFNGMVEGARYRLVTGIGMAREADLKFDVLMKELSASDKSATSVMEAQKNDKGEIVPAVATYHLRLARAWNMTGGCTRFRVALAGSGPAHKHEPYVGAFDRAVWFKVVRLGGLPQAAAAAPWAPLMAGVLADSALRQALGIPKYRAATAGQQGGVNQGFDFKTNIYVNSGAGGGAGGPAGTSAGGSSSSSGGQWFVNGNGQIVQGTSPWQEVNRQLAERSQREIDQDTNPLHIGTPGFQGLGWQSHWNAPRPEGGR